MLVIRVSITKFISDDQPGFVECKFTDVWGKEHIVQDKVPIVTEKYLDADSEYPQEGSIACQIIKEWNDANGLRIFTVTIAKPWSVDTIDGETEFDLRKEQLSELDRITETSTAESPNVRTNFPMNSDIISYYNKRAKEYDKIYAKPERQADLLAAEQILQRIFADKNVLEIACGTGYWTQKISYKAKNILATDINESVIEIAKSKDYPINNVRFLTSDIFELTPAHKQQALFGGFIWSHIKLEELETFIDKVNSLVEDQGPIVFMDNRFADDNNLPIVETDSFGNTYQDRTLEDGTTHRVIKNFPTETFIMNKLSGKAINLKLTPLQYYWILEYMPVKD